MEIEAELRKLEPVRNIIAHNNDCHPKIFSGLKLHLMIWRNN
jgi:hypothetical protein